MKTVSIKHIALSTCVGLFTFHTYMINTATYSQEFSLINPGERTIASGHPYTDRANAFELNCTEVKGVYEFNKKYYQPKTCEFKKEITLSTEKKSVFIKYIFKKGNISKTYPIGSPEGEKLNLTLNNYPVRNNNKLTITDQTDLENISNKANAYFKDISPQVAIALDIQTEEEEVATEKKTNHATAVKPPTIHNKKTAKVITKPVEVVKIETDTDTDPVKTAKVKIKKPTTTAAKVAVNEDEDEKENVEGRTQDIKDLLVDLDRILSKKQSCAYNEDTSEEVTDLRNSVIEIMFLSENITSFRKVKTRKIKKLSAEQAKEILAQTDAIDDILNYEPDEDDEDEISASLDDKITCLSEIAIKGDKEAQFKSYVENIKPLISGSIDGSQESYDEVKETFVNNTAFKNLSSGFPLIESVNEDEMQLANLATACKNENTTKKCIDNFTKKALALKENYIKEKDFNKQLETGLKFQTYNSWIANLGGEPVSITQAEQVAADNANSAKEILDSATAEQQQILTRLGILNKNAIDFDDTRNNARADSSARNREIVDVMAAKKRNKPLRVGRLGDRVNMDEIEERSGSIQ